MTKYWKAVRKTNVKGVYETGGVGGSSKQLFQVGKTYEVSGDPVLCNNGFHFYRKEDFCFGSILFGVDSTYFLEVEALSEVVSDTEKLAASSIKVVRYVPVEEWKKLLKKDGNSRDGNSGNSGDGNSGNSGDGNSGDGNSGDWNSGDWNSGDGNSGNWNSSNGYKNFFCTNTKYFLFDIEVSKEIIDQVGDLNVWKWFSLEGKTYYEAWLSCPKKELLRLREFKEFQTKEALAKFKEITGIDLENVKEND